MRNIITLAFTIKSHAYHSLCLFSRVDILHTSTYLLDLTSPGYEYKNFLRRYRSFDNALWPVHLDAQPLDLALCGFYYLGYRDKVQCATCCKRLFNWKPRNNAAAEHVRHSPKCAYMNSNIFLFHEYLLSLMTNLILPRYAMSVLDMASQFQDLSVREEDTVSNARSLVSIQSSPSNNKQEEEEEREEEEMEEEKDIDDRFGCKVCLSCLISTVFLPCKHMTSCKSCALRLEKCPICRNIIAASIDVIIP